jgi:hypothetical protein
MSPSYQPEVAVTCRVCGAAITVHNRFEPGRGLVAEPVRCPACDAEIRNAPAPDTGIARGLLLAYVAARGAPAGTADDVLRRSAVTQAEVDALVERAIAIDLDAWQRDRPELDALPVLRRLAEVGALAAGLRAAGQRVGDAYAQERRRHLAIRDRRRAEAGPDDTAGATRRAAARLLGRQLTRATRLENLASGDPARLAWGPALLETDDAAEYVVDCDEATSNLILRPLPAGPGPLREALARDTVRRPIASDAGTDPLRGLLGHEIVAIDAVSRAADADEPRRFALCGLRLHLAGGLVVCVGTHLTDSLVPSTAFLLPGELDPELVFEPIGDAQPGLRGRGAP